MILIYEKNPGKTLNINILTNILLLIFKFFNHEKVTIHNIGISGTKFKNIDPETIIKLADDPKFNNAALACNHSFYFSALKPVNNRALKGSFAKVVMRSFGSVGFFKKMFFRSAFSLLEAGWVWLVPDTKGSLEITKESNTGNPLRRGLIPLLTCDLWEYAYYLDYQNRDSDYLEAFWKLINLEMIEKRYREAAR